MASLFLTPATHTQQSGSYAFHVLEQAERLYHAPLVTGLAFSHHADPVQAICAFATCLQKIYVCSGVGITEQMQAVVDVLEPLGCTIVYVDAF